MNCNCVNPKPKCSEVNGITIVIIPGSLGDDSQGSIYAPTIGAYKNAVVKYLANGYVYVYDKDGAYTMIGDSDAVDIEVDQILDVKSKNAVANQAVSKALVKLTETVAKDYAELSSKTTELGEKIDTLDGSLAKVAKTGDYKDLLNKPVVDTALSTASRNAVENRAITTAINAEKAARESADAGIRSDVTTIDTAINKDVVTDIKLDPTPSTTLVNLDATKTNIKTSTSTTSSFPLPVASSTQAGVINSATYNSIREAIQIEQAVVHGAVAITGLPMSPTQQDITDAWKNATGLTDLVNRAEVYDVSHNKVWTYYENDTTWHATSSTTQVTVQQFTNSSLGTIKGSTIDGQIYAETNGTGSVNGWDTLAATVASSKSKLDTIEQGAEVNVQANWNQTTTTADDYIKNKPNLSTVATSGSYNDLTDRPIDSNTDVGNNINPIFVKDGILTASAGNVGNKFKPTYMANGNITASDATVGDSKTPVYMNAGTVTAMDELADVAFSGDYNDLKNKPGGGGSDAETFNVFDTVADMKSATNLIDGSFTGTYGYYTKGDGGGAKYKIRKVTNDDVVDETFLIEITSDTDNNLVAELVVDSELKTKQLGIKGDGTTDETSKLQKFFAYNTNKYVINSSNILIDGDMTLTSNSYVEFEGGCKITRKATSDEHYYMLYLDNVENVTINNAWLVGDRSSHTGVGGEWGHGINIVCSKNVEVLNSKIEYTWGDGIYIGLWNTTVGTYVQPENIRVSDCIIDHCSRNGISACSGSNIIIENTTISNTNRTAPKSGIDIELEAPAGQTPSFKNLIIRNVNTRENTRGIIINCSSTYDAGVVNITGHHSYKESQGVLMNTFDHQNSTLIYENGYIELSDTFAIDLSKLNNNTVYFKNVIIDSSVNNSLARDYHGAIGVRNSSNNTNGGFVFDNIKMIQSHTDAYVWRTLFMRNNSTTGAIEDIYINNYSWEPSLSIDLIYMASNGAYDWSKIKITNTTLTKTYNGDSLTLSATNSLFANIWNRTIWHASTSTISDSIPDGEYEITMPNTGSNVHTLVFNDAYSVYNGTSTSVTQRTYTANKSGSYIKFKKIGSEIYITGNIGYTAS